MLSRQPVLGNAGVSVRGMLTFLLQLASTAPVSRALQVFEIAEEQSCFDSSSRKERLSSPEFLRSARTTGLFFPNLHVERALQLRQN